MVLQNPATVKPPTLDHFLTDRGPGLAKGPLAGTWEGEVPTWGIWFGLQGVYVLGFGVLGLGGLGSIV